MNLVKKVVAELAQLQAEWEDFHSDSISLFWLTQFIEIGAMLLIGTFDTLVTLSFYFYINCD